MVSLVDGDENYLDSAGLLLTPLWRVDLYASAENFLSRYSQPGERPSCLVLERKLPGMSGLELLHRLYERGDQVPAVLLTAFPGWQPDNIQSNLHWPELIKPVRGVELVGTISAMLKNVAA